VDTIPGNLHWVATRRVHHGPADRVEDDVVTDPGELHSPWRHETRAVAGLPDLGVVLEDRDLEAGQSQVPCRPAAGRTGPDDEDVVEVVGHSMLRSSAG
jgi:hypothetical protein